MSKSGTLTWPLHRNTGGSENQFAASYADLSSAINRGVERFKSWRPSVSPKGSEAVTPIITKTDPLGVNGINGKLWTPESSPRFENGAEGFDFPQKHQCALDDLVKKLEAAFPNRA